MVKSFIIIKTPKNKIITRIINKEEKQIETICFNEFFEGNY